MIWYLPSPSRWIRVTEYSWGKALLYNGEPVKYNKERKINGAIILEMR